MKLLPRIISTTTFVLVLFFAVISLIAFLRLPPGNGDESVFIRDLILLKDSGYSEAVRESISIPYIFLAYPFSLLMTEYLSLRLVNIIISIGLVCYLLFGRKIRAMNFWNAYIFFFSTVGYFYFGTNDLLFFAGIIIFLTEAYFFFEEGKMRFPVLAFTGLIISFFTRSLILVYLPLIILTFVLLFAGKYRFKKKLIIPGIILMLLLVLNIPSLVENSKLSYDDKRPPNGFTWTQRQYLAQLLVNEGIIPNNNHPSWEEVGIYLKENGVESLPRTMPESLFFDLRLTLKEFIKDSFTTIVFSFRQIALGLILPIVLLLFPKGTYSFKSNLFTLICMAYVILTFSFIIISFVELRWLCPVFVLSIVHYGTVTSSDFKYKDFITNLNNIMIILMMGYSFFSNHTLFFM